MQCMCLPVPVIVVASCSCLSVCLSVCLCDWQMMLADGPSNSSPPIIQLPYSSTACSLMNLLSAVLSTLGLSDAEKRLSSGSVTAVANADTVTSQTTDIVRYYIVVFCDNIDWSFYNFRHHLYDVCVCIQESLAIAKTTTRCAQYMRALKSFESARKRPRLLFRKFRSILRMCIQNLKFVVLSVPGIIGGTQKIWAVPRYAHAPFSLKFLKGFCSDGPCEYTCQIWSS